MNIKSIFSPHGRLKFGATYYIRTIFTTTTIIVPVDHRLTTYIDKMLVATDELR